jgi:hypothetical protein
MGTDNGPGERAAAGRSHVAPRPGGVALRADDEDVLVVGYLSAVAAALDERGITVIMLCRDGQPEALAGTLVLHPSTARAGHGWGPTRACWHQNTGWSIQFYRGISGHLTAGRYLRSGPVPSPAAVAQFVAAVAAGRDVGASAPPQVTGDRQELLSQLDRFRAERCRGQGHPALPPAPRTTDHDRGLGRRAAGPIAGPAPSAGVGAGSGRVGAGGDDTRCGAPAGGARDGAAAEAAPLPPTLQQRQAALAKAAPARAARRRLREQVAHGELAIAAVLDRARTDPVVAKTRVADLLTALPGYGPVTVAALLCDARIHPARRVGGLGRRQRLALLDALTPESPGVARNGSG